MKHIVKSKEPEALRRWKNQSNDAWQPRYQDMPSDVKAVLRQALIQEQGCLCCYCQSSFSNKDVHIEHFRPQHDQQCDPLDYANMLCSCQGSLQKGEPRHCGMGKGDWFDEKLLLSPLDADCESRFVFTGDGRILPRDNDPAAAESIARLGLNIPKLRRLRQAVLADFLEANVSDAELRDWLAAHIARDLQGCYGAYPTAVAYVLREYLP